ncbi:hypothetical protein Tco_0791830 [Tanacetum coccineum]
MIMILKISHHGPSDARHNPSQLLRLLSKDVCFICHGDQHASIGFLIPRSLILKRWQSALASDHQTTIVTFRVILFSIHSDEWKSFQSQHQIALRYKWRRYNLIPAESRFKTSCSIDKDKYMMKAQVQMSKSSAISDVQALPQIHRTPTLLASTKPRTYDDLTDKEKIHEECDIRSTNIVLQGLPPDVYNLVNHHTIAKEIWDRVKLLIEGAELSLQERELKLYNEFDRFTSEKGETIHAYYLSKFVTDVKLATDMHESSFDQLYVYLRQHEVHANEVRMMRERFPDPLALYHQQLSPIAQQFYTSLPQPQPYEVQVHQQSYSVPVVHQTLVVHQQTYQAPVVQQQSPAVFPQLNSGLVVPSFLLADDPIASSRAKGNAIGTGVNINIGTFIANQIKTNDLDAFNSDCDEAPSASAILMAKLSAYDSDVLSKVPNYNTYQDNNVIDQSVQEMQYSQQPIFVDDSNIEITSDSNVISHKNLSTTIEVLKKETKEKEDKYIEEIIYLEKKKKALENIVYKQAQRKKPALYCGHTIVKKHDPLSMIDSEETLDLPKATRLKMNEKQNDPIVKEKRDALEFLAFFEIKDLKAQLQANNTSISKLKEHIAMLKGKSMSDCIVLVNNLNVISPRMYKLDLQPLSPKLRKNMKAHVDYLKQTKEHADILNDIIKQARALKPSDNALD